MRTDEILLVEDNAGDIRLVQEALRDSSVRTNLNVVMDGARAISFLRRESEYGAVPRPDLILLDLKLPGMTGLDVLAEIKGDPQLKRIPVVVLSSSSDESDVFAAYDLHASCYVTKPTDLDEFVRVVRYVEDFYVTVVKLPPNHATAGTSA